MRVLVTGHDGYIGSVMVGRLLSAGHEVVGMDTYFFEDSGGGNNNQISSIRKDVRDVTEDDLAGFEAVVHLAALCNDPLGDLNPKWTSDINHAASCQLARLAKKAGAHRFVYASSCSMYGKTGEETITEDAPLRPLTPYAISKVRAEEDISNLADDTFTPIFMRNATAYGWSSRLRADLVLNNLIGWAHTTGKVRITSDGTPWRPVVHVEDIAHAFAAVLVAPSEAVHNQAFNIGANKENYQVRELAEIVRATVPGCEVEYASNGGPDPRSYRVSFDKLTRLIPDFSPAWDARRGAKELYDGVRKIGLTLENFQGPRFSRLARFKELLHAGVLDDTLRWKEARRASRD
jgi:nucleoside-diphosphate-sugar epimerase